MVAQRLRAWFREKMPLPGTVVDRYLLGNLPAKMTEYKLATREALSPIEKRLVKIEDDLNDLEEWRTDTAQKINNTKKTVERLELKFGVA